MASNIGDKPTLEMILPAPVDELIVIAAPIIRRIQKKDRKSHPINP